MALTTIKPKKTLVEETYEILVDAICSGELLPGERLTQDGIAARLNVSRQPVNSALSILKTNMLVEDTGRRGVVVSPFDAQLFAAICEFRKVLEPFAVRLAAARLPPTAPAEAERVLAEGREAARAGGLRALLWADMQFHEMIYRWSGNAVIENSMRINWHHIRRSMAEVLRDPAAAGPVWDDHAEIVAALLSGDSESAAATMERHIATAERKVSAALDARADAASRGAA